MKTPSSLLAIIGSSGILLWLEAPTARSAERPAVSGFLSAPPMAAATLDGRVTGDAEWQSACQISGWTDRVLGMANHDGTIASVGHAGGTLYLLFRCPIPEKYRLNKVLYASCPLKMTAKEKDGDIFQDDYVGVGLTPPGSRDVYFLGVNGAGITCDSRNGDVSWNGKSQARQTHDDFVWTVELAIPLGQFGTAALKDGDWGVNFRHGARQIELLDSIWAYQPAEPYPMARMRLSPRPISAALTSFGNLSDGSLALRGQVANLSKEAFDGVAEVAVHGFAAGKPPAFGPEKIAISLEPGEKKALAADFAAGQPLCGQVTCTIKDSQGLMLLDHRLPFVFAREMALETRFIPTPSILQLVLDLGSPASFKKVASGRMKVLDARTKQEVASQSLPAFRSSLSIADIDCSRLPPGRYEAVVELRTGATLTALRDVFVKDPNPEWLGNKIGISDKVPPPWTPLRAEGRTVDCWGRQYTFGAAGFPRQINILGKDILARPVRILVKRNNRTGVLPEGTFQPTEHKEARASYESVSEVGGLKIAADAWIEFDGFVWNTIKVHANSPTEIDGLSVEIPLKKEYATLWWHPELAGGMLSDKMGAPPRQPHASAPINFLRLGDEDRGMQFFYENLDHWNPSPGLGQELIPGDKEYVLRYNLIGKPTTVEEPLHIALGYIALPCKPRSNMFRRIDVNGMWSATVGAYRGVDGQWSASVGTQPADKRQLEQAGPPFQILNIYSSGAARNESNYFNFWNEDVFDKDHLRKFKEQVIDPQWNDYRNTFCQYYQACVGDANTPEYRKYRFEWKSTPGNAPYVPPDPKDRDKIIFGSACHQSRSFNDCLVWYLDKTLRYLSDNGKIPIHGYQDCGGHPWCSNTLHGCPAQGHFPILANREHAKRVYRMFKAINPLNQVYIHTGGSSAMNWCGFFDAMIEGEQFTADYLAAIAHDPRLPKDYTRLINLERCRAQLQPYAWGPDRIYLWQFWQWMEKEPDAARGARGHIWGLQLVHDTPVWACRTPLCVARAIGALHWGQQVEFIPYWRKQTGIEVHAAVSPVVVSAWQRGKGNLVTIVLNDSDRIATGQLKIDFARFGFQPGEIQCRDYGGAGLAYPNAMFSYDEKAQKAVDPQRLPVADTVVSSDAAVPVEIGRHSFKLLWFHQ